MDLVVQCHKCGQKNRVSNGSVDKTLLCGACRGPLDTWEAAMKAAAAAIPTGVTPASERPAGPSDRVLLENIAAELRGDPDDDPSDRLEGIADMLSAAGFNVTPDEDEDDDPDEEDED